MRSILTQRQQWDLFRYADTDPGNTISATGGDDVDNPALAQGSDAFSSSTEPQSPSGTVRQPDVMQESAWSSHNAPAGGGGGSVGTGGGGGTQGMPSTPGTGVGVAGSEGAVPLIKKPDGTYTSSDPEWAKLINRESGGRNIKQQITDVNSGGNEAYGLFQITPGTWTAHGGQGSVYDSTPEQQAAVAANILRSNPTGSDWGAGLAGRENASALMKGLSTPSTPTPLGGATNLGTPASPAGLRNVNPSQGQGPTTGADTHGSLLPDTQNFKNSLQKQFPQLNNIGGYRTPDGPNEHSSGHALDIMTSDPNTQKQVRDWALQQPNVNYVLNQQKQWNPDGTTSNMPDRGGPTQNHYDHIHVNVAGDYQPDPSTTTPGTPPPTPMTVARRRKRARRYRPDEVLF